MAYSQERNVRSRLALVLARPATWLNMRPNSRTLARFRRADEWAKTPMGKQATKEYIGALRESFSSFG